MKVWELKKAIEHVPGEVEVFVQEGLDGDPSCVFLARIEWGDDGDGTFSPDLTLVGSLDGEDEEEPPPRRKR